MERSFFSLWVDIELGYETFSLLKIGGTKHFHSFKNHHLGATKHLRRIISEVYFSVRRMCWLQNRQKIFWWIFYGGYEIYLSTYPVPPPAPQSAPAKGPCCLITVKNLYLGKTGPFLNKIKIRDVHFVIICHPCQIWHSYMFFFW